MKMILDKFNDLKINLANMAAYMWVKANTLSNKRSQRMDLTMEEKEKMLDYLDMKVREMIKIIKRLDREIFDWE